jgi:predicted XRE-type DNA-binding protein
MATPKSELDLIGTRLSRARQDYENMAKKSLMSVIAGSGNVFADIGVAEPEGELAKAQLASRIREIVRGSRLTQVAAAAVMGIDQPKVSALLSGRLANFSSERLMRLLTRLGQDVEIVVKTKPRRRARGQIRVVQEARV